MALIGSIGGRSWLLVKGELIPYIGRWHVPRPAAPERPADADPHCDPDGSRLGLRSADGARPGILYSVR